MKTIKRRLAAAIFMALALFLSIASGLAAPGESPFAEFRIDASGMDVSDREISVDIYRRDDGGQFQKDSSLQYSCRLNRVTSDASLFIQASGEGVWVTVDYLTDINGDGIYELLSDDSTPVWDQMDAQGTLGDSRATLARDQLYILSPDDLVSRSRQASQDRSAGGAHALDVGQDALSRQEFPLCMVRLHRTDPTGGQSDEQTYYLQIYGSVLIPFDVSPSDWFYNAVEFVLDQGYFSGVDSGHFLPNGQLTRAQLAQVLWTVGGSKQGPRTQFFDVLPSSWYYPAVCWCQEEGLIVGYSDNTFAPNDPLTREQMFTILHRYAQYAGSSLRTTISLARFSDQSQVSPWAADGLRWAVTNGLISSAVSTLGPGEVVTRAELASALYSYELNLGLRR